MSHRALLIRHAGDRRDDRLADMLRDRGWQLEELSPADGDPLPPVTASPYELAVVYGGIESANDTPSRGYIRREIDWIAGWVEAERPYLGLCLGAQLLARSLGARVQPHPEGWHEIGYVPISATVAGDGLIPRELYVYQWHLEGFELPAGAQLLATGEAFPNQAFVFGGHAFGLQFHPEVRPAIVRRWIGQSGHMLAEPGAHPEQRQLEDAVRFDGPMHRWMERFLDRHLLPDVVRTGAASRVTLASK